MLTPTSIRAVAHEVGVHPETVKRYIDGSKQTAPTRAAIEKVLKKLGMAGEIRPAKPATTIAPPASAPDGAG